MTSVKSLPAAASGSFLGDGAPHFSLRTLLRAVCAAALLWMPHETQGAQDDVSLSLPADAAIKLSTQLIGTPPSQLLETLHIQDFAKEDLAVPIPMRDGVKLSATIISPRNPAAGAHPVVLIRTPYQAIDELSSPVAAKLIPLLVRDGYFIVVVNDRGTQWSQGSYHWLKGANQDGYDVMDWITAQPWSNGKVGTFGCSSSAESQLGLSTLNHPAHKAMVEMAGATGIGDISGYGDQGGFYRGGVPDLSWAPWYLVFGHLHHPQLPPDLTAGERARVVASYSPQPIYSYRLFDPADLTVLLNYLPSGDILRVHGTPSVEWNDLIRLSPGSPGWGNYDFIRKNDRTSVPALHIDSWYDGSAAYRTVKLFEQLARNSDNQHLIMGATAHCRMGTEAERTVVGDREVGDARFDFVGTIKEWLDHWLTDSRKNSTLPAVQYYVLNSSHWEKTPVWPPREAKPLMLFLQSGGHANSLAGDGRLETHVAIDGELPDTLTYDPAHPVPSPNVGGDWSANAVFDQSAIEARQDVLVYTTDAYSSTVRITGDVDISLSVSTSTPDTDLMAKVVDVYPDGRAYNLTDTALRLRYRSSIEHPALLTPGSLYTVTLRGMTTAADILPGHRLRIEIASSNFPNYERNLNTGGPNYDESQPQRATTKIFHNDQHPSFVRLQTLQMRSESFAGR